MFGPGKYDDLCTEVREKAKAAGVILMIVGGENGNGFSVQMAGALVLGIPTILRQVADQIEEDFKRKVVVEPRREKN